MLFALLILFGAGLSVNGPGGAPSAAQPSEALVPEEPTDLEPPLTQPASPTDPPPVTQPEERPADPRHGGDAARPAAVEKTVVLRPGDTLSALALEHDTSVEALQELNDLGGSTLIYAGDTLRVPVAAEPAGHDSMAEQSHRYEPAAPQQTDTGDEKPAVKGGAAAVAFAKAQLGKPYVWGGAGPHGFDCSGLVMRAWQEAGVQLPRTTWDQVRAGEATTRTRLVPGDLVITRGGGHVQLYIGDGEVIHAPRPGRTVTVAPLTDASDVVGYRHITR
ncbi:NlpC/P60 family protein [Streptomyces sp. NPDC032472]|uniref:C40 family peptidase n=1 Tax=Streptomyces sp. NPDC032472 TaxID=3155018 RepID=UPI0033EDD17F